jgi:hypothetical protein
VLERAAPQIAQETMEAKAARGLAKARAGRCFTSYFTGDGAYAFQGMLPAIDGQLVENVINQIAEKTRRQQRDATGQPPVERRQARADALVELCHHAQGCEAPGSLGSSGAKVMLTMSVEDLRAGRLGRLAMTGERVDGREARLWACDSDVMRAVIGAKGEILDIGRSTRTVPPGIRAAMALRDRGCCFPGCDRPPEACHAHHVRPWWQGGPTSLANLVSLCPHHHAMIEPPRDGPPGWEPRLRDDGLWELIPPPWSDLGPRPLLHERFAQASSG